MFLSDLYLRPPSMLVAKDVIKKALHFFIIIIIIIIIKTLITPITRQLNSYASPVENFWLRHWKMALINSHN